MFPIFKFMTKKTFPISAICLFIVLFVQTSQAKFNGKNIGAAIFGGNKSLRILNDTIPPGEVMEVINAIINSTNSFNIEAVANLYTPNAAIADDEPPYSWNGPTAGVQWVNAVEKACKANQLTKLTGKIAPINVYSLNDDNVYIVVPVSYTGNLPGRQHFAVKGAFTFVLRNVNGKWMVKSQAWMQEKALKGGN
jgi:hypothetical protein